MRGAVPSAVLFSPVVTGNRARKWSMGGPYRRYSEREHAAPTGTGREVGGIGGPPLIARIFTDFDSARSCWQELADAADVSFYQTWGFQKAWHDAYGAGDPLIVVVERDARPLFLWPLVRDRAVARFPGGRHANVCMPLVHRVAPAELRGRALDMALREIAARGVHLLVLHNVIEGALGLDTCLPSGWRFRTGTFFETALLPDFGDFLRLRRSRRAPARLRYRLKRLHAAGEVGFERIDDVARGAAIIDTLVRQKRARFARRGVETGFGDPRFRRFCLNLLRHGVLSLDVLRVNGRILAIYGGGVHAGRYSACVSSIGEEDAALLKHGPGEVLLAHLVERACTGDLRAFDLGVGTHAYKRAWCDRRLPARVVLLPLTSRGRLMALPRAAWYLGRPLAKRVARRLPALRRMAGRLLRRRHG